MHAAILLTASGQHIVYVQTANDPLYVTYMWVTILALGFGVILGVMRWAWKKLKKELTPNGGDTNRLGDRVVRLEGGHKELRDGQLAIFEELNKIKHSTRRREQRDFNRLVQAVREAFHEETGK